MVSRFDPPDPNFTEIAEPQFPVFPTFEPGFVGLTEQATAAVNALSDSHAQSLGLANVWLATIERVQGAELAGDAFWVREQSELAAGFAQQLADVLSERSGLREAVRVGFIESGFSDFQVTADDIRAIQAEIRASGLPSVDFIEAIPVQAFGITNQDLIDVTQEGILEVTPEDGTRSLPEIMTDPQLNATTQEMALLFAEFARQNGPPPPPPPSDLDRFRNVTLAGDYTAAGVGLRGRTGANINISGIPDDATVESAYLYWGFLNNGVIPALGRMNVNGTPVEGTLLARGPDTCWGRTDSFSYRTDVTTLVPGNGTYSLSGVASGGNILAQGASLVVLYEVPGAPSRKIFLMDGNVVFNFAPRTSADTTLSDFKTAEAVSAKTTFIVGDGQTFTETASFTGSMGTANFSNPFQGSDGRLWDTDTFDVSDQIGGMDMSAEVVIRVTSDCLMWVAQAFSVNTAPAPSDFDDDGVRNDLDNCPTTPNPDQADSNFNGLGDACETEGELYTTSAYLNATIEGDTIPEELSLVIGEEPPFEERLALIVKYHFENGLIDSPEEFTQNIVDSLVDIGQVPPEEADELVDEVLQSLVAPLIMDEDAFEEDLVDDDFDDDNGGTILPIPVGTILTLATGEGDDPGLFELTDDFPFDVASFIDGTLSEEQLEEVPGVDALDTPGEIVGLEGRTFCVVVYEDDVEIEDGTAELDEDRLGILAFTVTGTGFLLNDSDDDDGDEKLPSITIEVKDAKDSCEALGADIDGVVSGDDDDDDDDDD